MKNTAEYAPGRVILHDKHTDISLLGHAFIFMNSGSSSIW